MKKRHLQPVTRLTPQTQGQSSEHPFFPQRTVLLPSHLTRCLCERQSVLPCGSDRPSPATAGRATGNTEAVSQNYTHATATCKGNEGDQGGCRDQRRILKTPKGIPGTDVVPVYLEEAFCRRKKAGRRKYSRSSKGIHYQLVIRGWKPQQGREF